MKSQTIWQLMTGAEQKLASFNQGTLTPNWRGLPPLTPTPSPEVPTSLSLGVCHPSPCSTHYSELLISDGGA